MRSVPVLLGWSCHSSCSGRISVALPDQRSRMNLEVDRLCDRHRMWRRRRRRSPRWPSTMAARQMPRASSRTSTQRTGTPRPRAASCRSTLWPRRPQRGAFPSCLFISSVILCSRMYDGSWDRHAVRFCCLSFRPELAEQNQPISCFTQPALSSRVTGKCACAALLTHSGPPRCA